MAASSLSSLAFSSAHHLARRFENPNRHPLVRMIPRNPSRGIISCSAADPHRSLEISPHNALGWGSPFPLRGDVKSKSRTLVTSNRPYEISPEIEKTAAIAMVSCATVIDEVSDEAILRFSTFDSDGVLLKRFSMPAGDSRPCVLTACGDLLLIRADHTSLLCDIAAQELITFPHIPGGYGSFGGTGLGYVPSTKEFKVLSDLHLDRGGFKVLTLGADGWRDAKDPPLKVEHYGGAFVNGCIHLWSGHGDYSIPTFNLEKEQWGSIAGPPVQRSPPSYLRDYKGYVATMHRGEVSIRGPDLQPDPSLMELSGYLCMKDTWVAVNQCSIDIWLLKDYYKGPWVKECNIPYSAFNGPYMVKPLAIEEDGRVLVQVDAYSLQLYDPKTNTSQEIHRFEEEESDILFSFNVNILSPLGHR